MRSVSLLLAALAVVALEGPVHAENGGDRTAAGGAFMSSYSQGPYAGSVRAGDPAPSPGFAATSGRDVSATGSIERRAPRRGR